MALQNAVVRLRYLPFRRNSANGEIFFRPVSRKQGAAPIAQHSVVNRTRVERGRPIELTKSRAALVSRSIKDQLFIFAFEADRQVERQVERRALMLPPAQANLYARLKARVVWSNRNLLRVGEP